MHAVRDFQQFKSIPAKAWRSELNVLCTEAKPRIEVDFVLEFKPILRYAALVHSHCIEELSVLFEMPASRCVMTTWTQTFHLLHVICFRALEIMAESCVQYAGERAQVQESRPGYFTVSMRLHIVWAWW